MSSVFDCHLYSKDVKGGDTFVLKPTDKKVQAYAPNAAHTLCDTCFHDVWVEDAAETRKNKEIYQKQVDDWSGKPLK